MEVIWPATVTQNKSYITCLIFYFIFLFYKEQTNSLEKQWQSKSYNLFEYFNPTRIHTASYLTWEVQFPYQIADFCKISPSEVNQPNQSPEGHDRSSPQIIIKN